MAQARFSVRPYRGRVHRCQLIAGRATLFLPDFGAVQTRTVTDKNRQAEPEAVGRMLTYLAHGDAAPGNMAGPGFMATGRPAPVVVFESPDGVFFHYPYGPPACAGALWLNLVLSVKAVQPSAAARPDLTPPLPFGKARRASYLHA